MPQESIKQRFAKIVAQVKGNCELLKEEGLESIVCSETIEVQSEDSSVQPAVVANPSPKTVAPSPRIHKDEAVEKLCALREEVITCTACDELVKVRNSVVFGAGNAHARLCFVGEAPGYDEDQQGLPFVGKAGQLFTRIIEGIGLTREQVFIANVLKCHPPQNRNPRPEEIVNCEAYLVKQLEIIKPDIICALGTFPAQTLLHSKESISRLRGRFHDYHGIKLLPTFHPAFLLRNANYKKHVWEDMKKIHAELCKSE